jgi:hypothetical protein
VRLARTGTSSTVGATTADQQLVKSYRRRLLSRVNLLPPPQRRARCTSWWWSVTCTVTGGTWWARAHLARFPPKKQLAMDFESEGRQSRSDSVEPRVPRAPRQATIMPAKAALSKRELAVKVQAVARGRAARQALRASRRSTATQGDNRLHICEPAAAGLTRRAGLVAWPAGRAPELHSASLFPALG